VVGFYLVNLGFIAIALSAAGNVKDIAELFRFLGWYVGLAVLVLGAMHFFNMGAVTRHGKKVAEWVHEAAPPPVEPEPVERVVATTKRESILR
jgi:hypothetical protein